MRRKPKPDNRPHWNDELTITYRGIKYTSEQWQALCAKSIEVDRTPNYKSDPTYELRKKNATR